MTDILKQYFHQHKSYQYIFFRVKQTGSVIRNNNPKNEETQTKLIGEFKLVIHFFNHLT